MKVLAFLIVFLLNLNLEVNAELEIDFDNKFSISAESINISKNGILLGEYSNNLSPRPFNGLYLSNSGDLIFSTKAMPNFKITDIDEDEENYYASTYMTINSQQGLFKISKDFKYISNIGVKAATRKILVYKDKVYMGGYTHGCYVVNKDGTNLIQILGDGFFGPQIDDLKANSRNIYVLSRGNLYKVNYENNQKEQIIIGQRPSFIEVDENRLYVTSYNKFFYLDFNNNLTNEKIFTNRITYMKKFQNIIILVETDNYNNYFWISGDSGANFFKSKTQIPAVSTIKEIDIMGNKIYTLYLNISNSGIHKGNLVLDFEDKRVFNPPFKISQSSDLKDKITSFFDHRFPYLGNKSEPDEYKNTTLNFEGNEIAEPYMYYSSHDGIDWGLSLNTNVYSVADGIASYIYDQNGLGHAIKVEHSNGYITVYGHLSNEELILKEGTTKVFKGQKLGKVGMSGNTSGPHLHFTSYLGDKSLYNKVDPFGWEGEINDPWSEFGKKSSYLWTINEEPHAVQFNPEINKSIKNEDIEIEIINLSFNASPINLEYLKVSPIYNFKNYTYKYNTSYLFGHQDFESKNLRSVLGILNFKGFNDGDDKYYSIWKTDGKNVEKLTTVYNGDIQSLSTIFEPNTRYLVLKDNFKKISIKSKLNSKIN